MWMEKPDRISLLVMGIVAVGAVLRLWGLGFGLPMIGCNPDEPMIVRIAWGFGRGDLNPHDFSYPTLHFYILSLLFAVYYIVGRTVGLFTLPEFIANFTLDPSPLFLVGRGISAATGIATIYLVYALGRRAYGRGVGVLSAAFLSFSFLHVRESHFAKMDASLVFWIVLAYLFILRIAAENRRSEAVLAGVVVGLGASTKYNAFMMVVPLVLSHVVHHVGQGISWRGFFRNLNPYISCLSAAVALLATSPFILLDTRVFLEGFRDSTVHIRGIQMKEFAHLGPGWVYHAIFSLPHCMGLGLAALSGVGVLYALLRRSAPDLLLLSFCLVYYAVAGSGWLLFVRYLLPIIPLLCLFAARVLWEGAGWFGERSRPAFAAGVVFLLLIDPAFRAVRCDLVMSRRDTRLLAAEWIDAHVPSGAKVALGGSVWGRPNLLENPEVLRDRLKFIEKDGGQGRSIQMLLASPRYRAVSSFFTVAVGDSISPQRGGGPAIPDRHIDRLLTEGVEYLVVNFHPHLKRYGEIEPGLSDFLKRHSMSPVASFDPTDGQMEEVPPIFDPVDAFYVPLAKFGNTVRPGPHISIYRLTSR